MWGLGKRIVGRPTSSWQLLARTFPKLAARAFSSTLSEKSHIVIALGGNALLKRGQEMTIDNQRQNIRTGMASLQNIINDHTVTIVHGNGPQVGLLLLESAAYEKQTGLASSTLDVLDAETEGMIGYLIEQELQSLVTNPDRGMATLLSQIVVDPHDPSLQHPTKFVGPVYTAAEAQALSVPVRADGAFFRRVVPSPRPVQLIPSQMQVVRQLTATDSIVICAGGGGIPVVAEQHPNGRTYYRGLEAVIDKDRSAAMLGQALGAQGLLILTDVSAVATHFGTSRERWIRRATPAALTALQEQQHFPAGSMGPKIEAAVEFVQQNAQAWAAIGSLQEADQILAGTAGTMIRQSSKGDDFALEYYKHHHHDHHDHGVA